MILDNRKHNSKSSESSAGLLHTSSRIPAASKMAYNMHMLTHPRALTQPTHIDYKPTDETSIWPSTYISQEMRVSSIFSYLYIAYFAPSSPLDEHEANTLGRVRVKKALCKAKVTVCFMYSCLLILTIPSLPSHPRKKKGALMCGYHNVQKASARSYAFLGSVRSHVLVTRNSKHVLRHDAILNPPVPSSQKKPSPINPSHKADAVPLGMVDPAVQFIRPPVSLRRVGILRGEPVRRGRRRRDVRGRLVLGAGVRGRVVVPGLRRRASVAAGLERALRVGGRRVVAAAQGALPLAVDEDGAVDELH